MIDGAQRTPSVAIEWYCEIARKRRRAMLNRQCRTACASRNYMLRVSSQNARVCGLFAVQREIKKVIQKQ